MNFYNLSRSNLSEKEKKKNTVLFRVETLNDENFNISTFFFISSLDFWFEPNERTNK